MTMWDNIKRFQEAIDLSKCKSYHFDRRIFQAVFGVLVVILVFVAGNNFKNFFSENIYVSIAIRVLYNMISPP